MVLLVLDYSGIGDSIAATGYRKAGQAFRKIWRQLVSEICNERCFSRHVQSTLRSLYITDIYSKLVRWYLDDALVMLLVKIRFRSSRRVGQ